MRFHLATHSSHVFEILRRQLSCSTMGRTAIFLVAKRSLGASTKEAWRTASRPMRTFASSSDASSGLPDSIKRVGEAMKFPDEYPGQNYAFNWALNADGVTPLKKSSFRIMKPLDLKIASLQQPKKNPLKVKAMAASKMPEAGSDSLSFEAFDDVAQSTKDLLSLSDNLYCPEGHVPGTHTGVRIISNSATLAPDLLAYLDRAPKKDPPGSQPITAYVLEGTDEEFAGYAIEEVEEEVEETGEKEAKSVAAIVVVGSKPDIKLVVAGIEQSQQGLAADEAERAAKKAADAAAADKEDA